MVVRTREEDSNQCSEFPENNGAKIEGLVLLAFLFAMYIEELIIDGFKSYANRTVITGFDPNFNAIVCLKI